MCSDFLLHGCLAAQFLQLLESRVEKRQSTYGWKWNEQQMWPVKVVVSGGQKKFCIGPVLFRFNFICLQGNCAKYFLLIFWNICLMNHTWRKRNEIILHVPSYTTTRAVFYMNSIQMNDFSMPLFLRLPTNQTIWIFKAILIHSGILRVLYILFLKHCF